MNQNTESAILQAAVRLFKEYGYKGTMTNAIAKALCAWPEQR